MILKMDMLLSKLSTYKPHFRLTARITAGALISYWIMQYFSMQQGYWMVFTAILVTQTSVGGSVKAAVERMMGTFAGAAWGALICTFAPHDDPVAFSGWIVLALAPICVFAGVYPSFRIAPITVAIMLFGNSALSKMTPVDYAEHRVLDIGIGCIVGLVVSLTVLPSRAHRALAEAAAQVLGSYADLVTRLLEVAASQLDYMAIDTAQGKIRTALNKVETVGDEAKRERTHRLTNEPDPDPLLRMLRRIRNDLIMLGRAVVLPLPKPAVDVLAPPLTEVSKATVAMLQAAAESLKTDKSVKVPENFESAFSGFAGAIANMHRAHALSDLPDADAGRVFTLSFALEQLRLNLKDLAARVNDFTAEDTPAAVKTTVDTSK